MGGAPGLGPVHDYWLDAWQRGILFLDVLRQRGNTYDERAESAAPHVLSFGFELIRDGRTLPAPVNYLLLHIAPPEGVEIDPLKPPFVVVDPRAGHGPGIGGMKRESEIGVALAAGHPCYFIGFLPEPVTGQTIEDICQAEASFIAEVAARHPQAEGKPVVIANCQAGWQTMIMAALNPELCGPILLAGAPLSYWAGVRGKNPMRYAGGMLGGTWLTALAGDLGGGIFDGANLVANFESMNPANTFWQKPYNVWSKVDTEAERFLEFEEWWGTPVLLNAGEMQGIADNLFVGNKLTSGELHTRDGVRVDLRNIRSPIVVFCSWGDDITPPQQALGWITDLYEDDREVVANGQTIVYTLHPTIGHLGIFVSGKVAAKEHAEFASCMDMIDLMPPGLYEAIITEVDPAEMDTANIEGGYLFRLEARSLDAIRALGANSPEDDLRFAAAQRVSDVNLGLYKTLAQPAILATATGPSAELMRAMHPNRLRFAVFSDQNPMMQAVGALAKGVREDRRQVAADNPLVAYERLAADWISTGLQAYGAARDAMTEAMFLGVYGSPVLHALVGLDTAAPAGRRRIERDLVREAHQAQLRTELEARFEVGGAMEAVLRAMIYVRLAEPGADERTFELLRDFRATQPPDKRIPMAQLKATLKEQYLLVRLDEERAVQAIPKLAPEAPEARRALLNSLRKVITAPGPPSEECRQRLDRVAALLEPQPETPAAPESAHV
jgi:pimeloyl-ACP methyl ester carboxylesterase